MHQALRNNFVVFLFKKTRLFFAFVLCVLLTSYFLILIAPAYANDMGMTTSKNMTVSADIFPQPPDYQFDLEQETGQTTVTNSGYYGFTITYGAKQSASFDTANTVIIFDWSKALAPNGQNMFDYVYGSAGNTYGGVKPVVDTGNKTVTWTIPNLPPGTTDQKAKITLFANSYDNTAHTFPLSLTASMTNQYLTMPEQTLIENYKYQPPLPGPTATPGPQPTATPTPPPPPPPLYTVDIPGISQNGANISITTAYPSKLTVSYGTSPTHFFHTLSSNDYTYHNSLNFPDLAPDTKYYFTVTITSLWGYSTSSDIYTFRTAKATPAPNVDNNIVVFTANGNVYFSDTQKQDTSSQPSVILTDNSTYEISYELTKPIQVRSIDAVVVNKILGAQTSAPIPLSPNLVIPMQQKEPNLYAAAVKTLASGLYEVYVRITDSNGNIIQKKITDLKVMPKFTVYAKDTRLPLQDARVFLSYFDSQTNTYRPLTQQQLGTIPNPGYTNEAGELAVTLPAGKYRVEESALFYKKIITDFTIGPGLNQNYPVIYLERDPLNTAEIITFSGNYLGDTWNKIVATLLTYSESIRLFHLFAVAILGSFIIVNFLLFTLKSQIKAHHLPVFFLFHVDKMLNLHQQKYIFGTITDEKHKPVSQALIEFEDRDTKKILLEISTNKAGRFYCRNNYAGEINLLVSKTGYEVATFPVNTVTLPEQGLHLTLKQGTEHFHSPLAHFKTGISEGIGILFETSLVITIILEVLFFSIYGFAKTTPYLVLSIINILLWLFYIHEHNQKSSF